MEQHLQVTRSKVNSSVIRLTKVAPIQKRDPKMAEIGRLVTKTADVNCCVPFYMLLNA